MSTTRTARFSTKSEREALLAEVRKTQTAFWDALHNLEKSYDSDAELSSADDYEQTTIDSLDEDMRAQGFHVVDVLSVGE